MKLHAFRLGTNADWNTHTVLNACPQQQKMNAGVWLGLENKTAKWADRYGKIWIVAGPVCYNGTPKKMIGDSGEMKIAVPHGFFKIVIKEKSDGSGFDVLAFLFPQKGLGNYSSTNHDPRPYVTSIDTIEALTGLDFLTDLDDDTEEGLRASCTSRFGRSDRSAGMGGDEGYRQEAVIGIAPSEVRPFFRIHSFVPTRRATRAKGAAKHGERLRWLVFWEGRRRWPVEGGSRAMPTHPGRNGILTLFVPLVVASSGSQWLAPSSQPTRPPTPI